MQACSLTFAIVGVVKSETSGPPTVRQQPVPWFRFTTPTKPTPRVASASFYAGAERWVLPNQMNPVSIRPAAPRRCVALVGALGAFLPGVLAQTAPAPSTTTTPAASTTLTEKDTIVLTPFEVTTEKDVGYAAANTLAGGRINTPLELTPSAITVITKQFMEDFAINNFQDATQWTMNVDNPSGANNEAPFGGNRNEFNVRGAGGAGNYPIRDGVQQYFVADSYNSERFEVVSGPNSGLAGLGNSGGLAGSSSKRVRYDSISTNLSTRVDSFGGYRGSLDHNYATQRFGVRVNAMHQNQKTIQKGTEEKQNAITLRGETRLGAQTNLSFQFEKSSEWNTQYRRTYGDQQNLWNRTTVNLDNSALTLTGTGLSQINTNATNDRLVYNFGTNSVINVRGNQYQTTGLGHQIPWEGNPNIPTEWAAGANMLKGFDKHFWLGPVDNFADRDNNTKSAALDHTFSPNLTARLSWQGSDVDSVTYWGDFSQPGDYRIDVNRLLPDGTINPNFLRAYSEWGAGGSQYQQNSSDEYTAEGSYRFTVPRWFDLKQTFNAIYAHRIGDYTAWSRTWRRNNNPAQLNPLNATNQLTFRTYYGDPQPRIQPIITQQGLNALIPGTTWGNYGGGGWHADSERSGRSAAIYSTTSFFQDRLVISGNYKRDRILNGDRNGITINNLQNDPNDNYRRYVGAVNPATGLPEDGYMAKLDQVLPSFGLGTVITPFPEKWKWLAPIKFVVNYSENNREPTSGGPFYTGERPGAPFNSTTDFAIRYSIPGGKVYIEARRYFTENIGNLGGMANTAQIQTIWRNLGYTSGTRYDFQSNSFRDTSDRDLMGTEVQVTANPTPNWTLTANYGHPRVQTKNERPYLRRYVDENIAEWRAGAALTDGSPVPGTDRNIVSQNEIITAIQQIEDGFNGLQPGTIGNGPVHRGSFSTGYNFREGKLRGFRVSGGVSWRGSSKAGSRDARLKFQNSGPTVPTAQAVAAAYDYLWVPSQLTNNLGLSYSKRFGKYQARFQLNITNLLDDDKPQWGANNSNAYSVINAGQMTNQNNTTALTVPGSNPRMQVLTGFSNPEPRKFVLTTSLDF